MSISMGKWVKKFVFNFCKKPKPSPLNFMYIYFNVYVTSIKLVKNFKGKEKNVIHYLIKQKI